ncbi:MAG: hypothetical protein JW908_16610 [Anaerolineales bacterium]|nr:hypothetical protein [Anaerolineales bacterium]
MTDTQLPVLLVHGIDNSSKRLRTMQRALLQRGFSSVVAMDIVPSNGSIRFEAMGKQVRDAAFQLLHSTGAPKIDIVAYSMGALAARYFIQRLGGKSMVRRFVSISGPHHGTFNAYFRLNTGCRQMRPNSDFLIALNSDIDPFGDVAVFSFYTPYDLMVLPGKSSIIPGAHNRAFPVLLHPLMTFDRRVIEAVAQTLANG